MIKAQAKRMNVQSICSNKEAASVEIRIAKAAFTIFFLFFVAWGPYACVALIGAFGDRKLLTPLATMIPAVCCKIVSCLDPWVYAISHPRYRAALQQRLPWLGVKEELKDEDTKSAMTAISNESTTET